MVDFNPLRSASGGISHTCDYGFLASGTVWRTYFVRRTRLLLSSCTEELQNICPHVGSGRETTVEKERADLRHAEKRQLTFLP